MEHVFVIKRDRVLARWQRTVLPRRAFAGHSDVHTRVPRSRTVAAPMPEASPVDLKLRASFPRFCAITIRFADLDLLGHVNNVALATYLEHGRIELIGPLMRQFGSEPLDMVLARITIDYLRELQAPGTIEVATRVARLGSKSMILQGAVFKGETCIATAHCVMVFFDTARRRSVEPPAALRAALEHMISR